MPGPTPKRKDEVLGHDRVAKDAQLPVDKVEFTRELIPPDPDPGWVPIAAYAWQAFLDSPLNQFYTETDLAFGWMTCQAIHDAIANGSAMKTSAAESMMRAALFSESDRRRVRIEVTRHKPEENETAKKNKDELAARRAARDAR